MMYYRTCKVILLQSYQIKQLSTLTDTIQFSLRIQIQDSVKWKSGHEKTSEVNFQSLTSEVNFHIVCVLSLSVVSQLFVTPRTVLARLLCPWNSPGKNTGVGCHSLLQGIFPTWRLPYCRQILYCLSHQRSIWLWL